MCLGTRRFPSASGGLPPRLLPPFEGGWVHCPAPKAPLTREMPTGPRAFLANSGRVWATALRPVPPKKRPCALHARKVGRASNTTDHYRCYTNSTRLLTFSVLLSFLFNIICYIISVFLFSLVTLSEVTTIWRARDKRN